MQIKELLKMQRELDEYVAEKKGLGNAYEEKFLTPRKLALLVEIGELANATRCFKYWSEKAPEPKERILDELADCMHFALSLINLSGESDEFFEELDIRKIFNFSKEILANGCHAEKNEEFIGVYEACINEEWESCFVCFWGIASLLNFTAEEIEQAYLKKHEVNYKRQTEGY